MTGILRLSNKTYLLGLLIALAIAGIFQQGYNNVFPQLVLAVTTSIVVDLDTRYIKTGRVVFPSSAFITGLIIALVLPPAIKWYVPVVASSIAILQKHIIRYRGKHIFNPANFGLLAVLFIFSVYPNWWGQNYPLLIVLVGGFICYNMKRLKLPLIFIASFTVLFSLNNLFTQQPMFGSALLINVFFVFIMLIEPKTSPVSNRGIVVYAVLVALFSFLFFKAVPQFSFVLLALALGNLFVPFLNILS